MIQIHLKRGREKSVHRFHPWLFSGAIHKIEGNPIEGSPVEVLDSDENVLGVGYYGSGSIAVRFLSFRNEDILGQSFWNKALKRAYDRRVNLEIDSPKTNCYRLVHGEGDNIPGLILDYYDGVVIFQAHNAGIYTFKDQVVEGIKTVLGKKLKAIFHKPKEHSIDDSIPPIGFWYGDAETGVVLENGFQFGVDWMEGQKTGFFIDQRDNRALIMRYAKGRSVLNTFCFTGGFSIYAAAAGAKEVVSVDISPPAVNACKQNLINNGFEQFSKGCEVADSFNVLKESGDKFDLIVLDPPSFAKSMKNKGQATKGYRRLNLLALQKIKSGGIIFSFSCTQVVDRQLFEDTVFAAAIESGRNVKILHRMGQPADHAINFFHPESEYLKGLVLLVD